MQRACLCVLVFFPKPQRSCCAQDYFTVRSIVLTAGDAYAGCDSSVARATGDTTGCSTASGEHDRLRTTFIAELRIHSHDGCCGAGLCSHKVSGWTGDLGFDMATAAAAEDGWQRIIMYPEETVGIEHMDFAAVSCRLIKLSIDQSTCSVSNHARVFEVEVYGEKTVARWFSAESALPWSGQLSARLRRSRAPGQL